MPDYLRHQHDLTVQILSSDLVLPTPSLSTHPSNLWTSNLDLVILNGYIKTVYFFPSASTSSNLNDDIRRIRQGLSSALSVFWPMAGRLSHDSSGRLQIDCNDAGALFVHASCSTCSIDSLPGGFTPNPNLLRLVPSLPATTSPNDLASLPLLLVQVTRFKCGGVAIGVGVEHHVADGKSAVQFLNAWADMSRGVPFSEKVNFDRSCLQARTPPTPEFVHEEYLSLPLPPNYVELKQKKRKDVNSKGGSPDGAEQNGHVKRKQSPPLASANGSDVLLASGKGEEVVAVNGHSAEKGDRKGEKTKTNGHVSPTEENGAIAANGHDGAIEENGHLSPTDGAIEANGHHISAYNKHKGENGHHHAVVVEENGHSEVTKKKGENGNVGEAEGHNDGRKVENGHDDAGEEGGVANGHGSKGVVEENGRGSKGENGHATEEAADEEEVVVQMVDISKEFVQGLKKAGTGIAGLEKPLTSHEMLAAQVWKAVCEARRGGGEGGDTSRLIVAVDGRSRMRGLPDGYFGNVIFTSVASAASSEVAAAPLPETALRVRRSLRKLDDPYCRSALDFLELEPDTWRFVKGAHTWAAPNVGFTSWAQLPMYECDFGWGPPCHIGPAHVAWDGLAYVTNPPPSAEVALRLIIALRRRHAAAFLPAFLRLPDSQADV